jgi:putative membrane protein (TIGR04086 family)
MRGGVLVKRNNNGSSAREASRLYLNLRAVIYGIILAFLWSGLIVLAFGFLGFYIQGWGEKTGALVFVAGLVGACLGAVAAARRVQSLGWLHGGLVGFGFIFASYLIGLIWETGTEPVTSVVLYRLFWGTALGLLGGMMGVNL